ncbi:hypothetical protein [Streptomyces mirabilis]|uniref:hypothetical protein n=1 Tax=Streptomyces mirabilis TaxID=68239 RepID=UPI00332BA36E
MCTSRVRPVPSQLVGQISLMNGSLLAILELWCNQPEADSDQAAGTMAEMILHMLGLSPDEARALARRPLPAAAGLPPSAT